MCPSLAAVPRSCALHMHAAETGEHSWYIERKQSIASGSVVAGLGLAKVFIFSGFTGMIYSLK